MCLLPENLHVSQMTLVKSVKGVYEDFLCGAYDTQTTEAVQAEAVHLGIIKDKNP